MDNGGGGVVMDNGGGGGGEDWDGPRRKRFKSLSPAVAASARLDAPGGGAEAAAAGAVAIDIGANCGQSTAVYLAAGLRVIAVEPDPRLAALIRAR